VHLRPTAHDRQVGLGNESELQGRERLLQPIRDCATDLNFRPKAETYRHWQLEHPNAPVLATIRKYLGSWESAVSLALGETARST